MKKHKLGKRTWFNIILFGLMGQIAWNVENMYFNTFLYNSIYSDGVSQAAVDGSITVMSAISLMVALSAVTAVVTTFVMGTLSDRMKNRKLFISVGYILWGIVTALFSVISRDHTAALFHLSDEVKILTFTVWTVILMDCLMTFMGSTSNDSAFNAWVTDVTEPENRPLVEALMAALPLVAMGIVIGTGTLAQTGVIGYNVYFLALGGFVIACGIIGLFTLQEPEHKAEPQPTSSNYWNDLFYGFRPSVIKSNSRLYLTLSASCFFSIAIQVFFPYLLIYLQYVVLPGAEGVTLLSPKYIIAAVFSVAFMAAGIIAAIKVGNKNKAAALIPCSVSLVIGLLILGMSSDIFWVIIGIAPTIVGYAIVMIMLNASVRDFTPDGKAGQFQGIRMIFGVLIPMIIGPVLGNIASSRSAVSYTNDYGVSQLVPTSAMFTYAAIVSALIFIPLIPLVKKGFAVLHAEQKIAD